MAYNSATNTYDRFSDLRLAIGQGSSSIKCLGRDNINDGFGGIFYYNSSSTAPDDNQFVIQPQGVTTGRWLKLVIDLPPVSIPNLQTITDKGNSTTNPVIISASPSPLGIAQAPIGLNIYGNSLIAGGSGNQNLNYNSYGDGIHIFKKRGTFFGGPVADFQSGPVKGLPSEDPTHFIVEQQLTDAIAETESSTNFTGTIAQIRSLTGKNYNTFTSTDYGTGSWYLDLTDTTTPDNTGTVLVTSDNKRVKRIYDSELAVEWFGGGTDGRDNSDAFDLLFSIDKASVKLNTGTYEISRTISLTSGQSIIGSGNKVSWLKIQNGTDITAIRSDDNLVNFLEIRDIGIEGNASNQTDTNTPIIDIESSIASGVVSPRHTLSNIYIQNAKGLGLRLYGRGEGIVENIYVNRCQNGMDINLTDQIMHGLDAGQCKDTALRISGGNNTITGFKFWGSIYGVIATAFNRSRMDGGEIQDIQKVGLTIDNSGQSQFDNLHIDGVGWDFPNQIVDPDSCSIVMTSTTTYCRVTGNVTDISQFSITGSQLYALELLGNHNTIDLIATGVLNEAVKGDIFNTNTVAIRGLKKDGVTRLWQQVNPSKSASRTSLGNGADLGYWAKVCEVSLGTQTNSDFSLTLGFASSYGDPQSALVTFSGRQTSTGNAPSIYTADIIGMSSGNFFTDTGFRIVNNGFGLPFEIWVRKNSTLGVLEMFEVTRVARQTLLIEYINVSSWVSGTPTGTYLGVSNGLSYIGQQVGVPYIINATDSNVAIPQADSIIFLPEITQNRTFTVPGSAQNNGKSLTFVNQNTSAFTWSLASGSFKDTNGSNITTIPNQTVYRLIANSVAAQYVVINKTYLGATVSTLGLIRLTGDLGGTADSPSVNSVKYEKVLTDYTNSSTNADYTLTKGNQYYQLPAITANRILTFPIGVAGQKVVIFNRNNSIFTWNPNVTITDANGDTVTTLRNNSVTEILYSGVGWRVSNVYIPNIKSSATLDFPSVPATSESTPLTITLTGITTSDSISLTSPSTTGIIYKAYVSATNTVSIIAVNYTGSPIDPASGTFIVSRIN